MKKIVVKKEYIPKIKNEDKFINAIQLGRIIAAIRYNKILYTEINYTEINKDKKVNSNIKLHLMLNQASLVYIGIKKFNNNKSDFENVNYYKENLNKIKRILNEANDRNSFTNTVLKKIRNKIAFHFDKAVIKEIIGQFIDYYSAKNEYVVFISGKSEFVKDISYSLADDIIFNYVLKSIKDKGISSEEKFKILSCQ